MSLLYIQGLTLGRWLHSDLVTEVTSACSGNSCSPDQVLLPVVEVSDSVEQQLWIGFILAGQLGRAERRKNYYSCRTFDTPNILTCHAILYKD